MGEVCLFQVAWFCFASSLFGLDARLEGEVKPCSRAELHRLTKFTS
jgi:hypothetical protein